MASHPSYDRYIVALSRKAKNHSAKEYRFTSSRTEHDTPKRSAAATKMITLKYLTSLREGKWFDDLRDCRDRRDVYAFITIQERLLAELSTEPIYIPACFQAVHGPPRKAVSLYDKLLSTAEGFTKMHCPNSALPELFALLERPVPLVSPDREINYQRQVSKVCSPVDRQLQRQRHPRCIGFTPTRLQRQVIDSVDLGQNIIMRSPTGTGKTMTSLYLAQVTQDRGKATLYVAPTKPICNEFSIFAYHQGLRISINTEDFSSDEEIRQALKRRGILIWTPGELFMHLIRGRSETLSQVGSVIFDELPRMLQAHRSAVSFLLLAAATQQLQMMVLSATLSDSTIPLLNDLAPFQLLESGDSLKPTDLLLHSYDPQRKHLTLLETSALYSSTLLCQEAADRLKAASRIPITWSEFNAHSQRDSAEHFNALCRDVLPTPRVLRGMDLTRIVAMKAEERALTNKSSQEPEAVKTSECSGSEEVTEEEVEVSDEDAKKLFDFLLVLRQKQMLPVMLFHSQRHILSQYHAKCTELLLEVEEKRAAAVPTRAARAPTAKLNPSIEEMQDAAEDVPVTLPPLFGHVGNTELCEFFRHRNLNRLGGAGMESKQSRFWEGISLGLGIYHHGVERKARDTVENSLRAKFIHVVFSDASLAFGLNLPVKTVVILPDDYSLLTPDQFLQAAGRAGRWGYEEEGHVVFYNGISPVVSNIWNPYHIPSKRLPFSELTILALLTTTDDTCQDIVRHLFDYSVEAWGLTPSTTQLYFKHALLRYREIGFLSVGKRLLSNKDFDFRSVMKKVRTTLAGQVVAALEYSMGAHFAGFCLASHGKKFGELLRTPQDLMFFVTHCIEWRGVVEGYGQLRRGVVDDALWDLIQLAKAGFDEVYKVKMTPTEQLTALFVDNPSKPRADDLMPADLNSLRFHVHQKAKKLHYAAQFEFEFL